MSVKFPQRQITGALITLGASMLLIAGPQGAVVLWLLAMLGIGTIWLGGCSLRRRCRQCDRSFPAAFYVCTSCGCDLRTRAANRQTRSTG